MRMTVRNYERRDRDAVRYICCETGFMGEPMEVVFEGREVFADLWTKYYTDYEPEHTWVADVEGIVVGYILGALDSGTQVNVFKKKILPSVGRKFLTTECSRSLKTWKYIARGVRGFFRGEFDLPNLSREYQAHLHTNILDGYRGLGLGTRMMDAWVDHLATHGARGVHLETTSYNKQAVPFYKRCGFETIFEKQSSIYEGIIAEPFALVGMGRKLA